MPSAHSMFALQGGLEAVPAKHSALQILAERVSCPDGEVIRLAVPVAHIPGLADPGYQKVEVPADRVDDPEVLIALEQTFPLAGSFEWLASVPKEGDDRQYVRIWRRWSAQRRSGHASLSEMPTREGVARFFRGESNDINFQLAGLFQ